MQSANGAPGKFLLSLQGGLPIAAPISLVPGQGMPGIVDAQNAMHIYNFSSRTSCASKLKRVRRPVRAVLCLKLSQS